MESATWPGPGMGFPRESPHARHRHASSQAFREHREGALAKGGERGAHQAAPTARRAVKKPPATGLPKATGWGSTWASRTDQPPQGGCQDAGDCGSTGQRSWYQSPISTISGVGSASPPYHDQSNYPRCYSAHQAGTRQVSRAPVGRAQAGQISWAHLVLGIEQHFEAPIRGGDVWPKVHAPCREQREQLQCPVHCPVLCPAALPVPRDGLFH